MYFFPEYADVIQGDTDKVIICWLLRGGHIRAYKE